MKIALVGFTNSYNDQQWLEMARAWMETHSPTFPWSSAEQIIFDLRGSHGKNFLDDAGEYAIVILFAIYNPPADTPEFARAQTRPRGQTSLAPNHTRDNWSARLSRTNARQLFIFRRDDSIDGQWLGEIANYKKHPEQPGVFGVSIYSKQDDLAEVSARRDPP